MDSSSKWQPTNPEYNELFVICFDLILDPKKSKRTVDSPYLEGHPRTDVSG